MPMRWRILALLFATRIGLGFQFQALGSVSDDLVAIFGLRYADIGTLVGLFMLPGIFLALPAGFCGRFLSDRVLCCLGLLALALGGLTCALAGSPWLIGTGRAVSGMGFLVSTLYFTKMTVDWFSGREIATAMAILVMSWPFGIALGQIGHKWIALEVGWRWTFAIAAAYGVVGAAALFAWYRPPEERAAPRGPAIFLLDRRELSLVVIAALGWGVFNAGYIVYLNFGPLMLQTHGLTAIEAAATISIGSWLMILSGAACGQIADRTRRPDLTVAICMLGAMVSLALLKLHGAGAVASLMFGLIGMAPAGVIMALIGEAMRPEKRAFGMGVFLSVYFLINAVAPPVAGWVFDATRDAFSSILFGIGLFGMVPVVIGWFRVVQRRQASSPVPSP